MQQRSAEKEISDVESLKPEPSLQYGNTALMWAARKGFVTIVRLLLAHAADPRRTDTTGNTALHMSIRHHRDQCAHELIRSCSSSSSSHHLPLLSQLNDRRHTALNLAARHGRLAIVESILTAAGDQPVPTAGLNTGDVDGETPVMKAVLNGHGDVLAKLLKVGARVNGANRVRLVCFVALQLFASLLH